MTFHLVCQQSPEEIICTHGEKNLGNRACFKKLRQFLHGEYLTIVRDHFSLKWFLGLNVLQEKLARWVIVILDFDCKARSIAEADQNYWSRTP